MRLLTFAALAGILTTTFVTVAACGGGGTTASGGSNDAGDGGVVDSGFDPKRRLTREQCDAELKLGADLTNADFGVKPENRGVYNVYAESFGQLAATSAKLRDDAKTGCQAIAKDLGAAAADQSAAEAKTDPNDRAAAWCSLAGAAVTASAAQASFQVITQPAAPCTPSAEVKAACQPRCGADGKCAIDCDHIALAKAFCASTAVTVQTTSTEAQALKLKATLEANLPAIVIVAKSRGQAYFGEVVEAGNTLNTRFLPGQLDANGTTCLASIAALSPKNVADARAAIQGAALVTSASGF